MREPRRAFMLDSIMFSMDMLRTCRLEMNRKEDKRIVRWLWVEEERNGLGNDAKHLYFVAAHYCHHNSFFFFAAKVIVTQLTAVQFACISSLASAAKHPEHGRDA